MKTNKDSVNFLRQVRTENSEVWLIDLNENRLGILHLHLTTFVNGDVILTKKITENQLQLILNEIEDKIVSSIHPREDFIFSVFQAKEIGSYSDIVDHDLSVPTKRDLNEHKKLINNVLAKYQDARGQLSEHVVKEYFSKLGYQTSKASSKYDALKVDIIAENEEFIIFCQVKLGKISKQTIHEISECISKIHTNEKKKIIGIVADSFPIDIELIKDKLETKFEIKIWTIFKNQILSELPEYKRTLKN